MASSWVDNYHSEVLLSIYFAFDCDLAWAQLKAPEPILSGGTQWEGAAKLPDLYVVITEVIFLDYSFADNTTIVWTIVDVHMERNRQAVTIQM